MGDMSHEDMGNISMDAMVLASSMQQAEEHVDVVSEHAGEPQPQPRPCSWKDYTELKTSEPCYKVTHT